MSKVVIELLYINNVDVYFILWVSFVHTRSTGMNGRLSSQGLLLIIRMHL